MVAVAHSTRTASRNVAVPGLWQDGGSPVEQPDVEQVYGHVAAAGRAGIAPVMRAADRHAASPRRHVGAVLDRARSPRGRHTGRMAAHATSPYSVLVGIVIACLLIAVVGFAVGGYTREGIFAFAFAFALTVAVVVGWTVRGSHHS